LAGLGREEAGGVAQPLIAIGGADLLLGLARQAGGGPVLGVAGAVGALALHAVEITQDALVDGARLLEIMLVGSEELGVPRLRGAAVQAAGIHLALPLGVEL